MKPSAASQSLYAILAGDQSIRDRLESIGGRELLAQIVARAQEPPEPSEPVLSGGTSLKAAIHHTFVVSELDAPISESSAILGASAVIAINGVSRLRLEDASRAAILDHALVDGTLSRLLAESAAADATMLRTDDADTEAMTSAWLRVFLRNQKVDLTRQSVKQLSAAFAARSALRLVTGLGKNIPEIAELKRLNDLAELVEPLRIMIGLGDPRQTQEDRFAGRSDELKQLRSFVDQLGSQGILESISRTVIRTSRAVTSRVGYGKARLMMISAPGGLGKSTLMAKFVLDHAVSNNRLPFAYLDFDRATLQPRNPSQLLIEAARQVALYFPKETRELTQLRNEMRAGLAETGPANFEQACEKFRRTVRNIMSKRGARTFLLVLDTFEIVQSDPKAVEGVVEFLSMLASGQFSELAIVVSGRAEVEELCDTEKNPWSLERLVLDPLKLADAIQMVDLLGESLIGTDWRQGWARKIAGRNADSASRREPLTLRIAVEIVRNAPPSEREGIINDIALLGERADETFVGRLYEKRILEHIVDKDARKLAWPGLIARRITPALARHVLAPICELTPEQADAAFERLGREVWIVEREGNALRHRADLRARTLPLMRRRNPEKFEQVTSAMVSYYAGLGGDPQNASEAVYYRLLRGDDPEFLDKIWSADLASALARARDDFESGTPTSLQLEARLATRLLPTEKFVKLPDTLVWEHVARAGSGLRQLDDTKVDRRILNLLRRPPSGAKAVDVAAARQSILIKGGQWRILSPDNLVFPSNDIDAVQAAFFATVAAGAGLVSPKSLVYQFRDMLERLGDRTNHTTWKVLAYSLLPALLYDKDLYSALDRRLAMALSTMPILRRNSRDALRAAISFGQQSMSHALLLFTKSLTSSEKLSVETISADELRVLVSEQGLISFFPNSPLPSMAAQWIGNETASIVSDRRVVDSVFQLLSIAAKTTDVSKSPSAPAIRRFAATRFEAWAVPVGYAIALAADVGLWREVISNRVRSYVKNPSDSLLGSTIFNIGMRDQLPRDPVRLALLADASGDLGGFVKESLRIIHDKEAIGQLKFIADALNNWTGRTGDLLEFKRR